ncbi:MAG: polysaccharide biosynthesis C-terminal domain-containing protein [Candidatus Zixiibacteriota bacterium]
MKRLFKNTVFTSLDYFVLIVLNLLATPILIKHFGVDGYGAFVFLSIFSIYGALSFFDLGMEGSLMNYVARFDADKDKRKLQDTLSASILYYALLGLILGIGIYLAGDIIAGRLIEENGTIGIVSIRRAISFISINIFLQFLTVPFMAVLQGMRRFVITKLLSSIITTARYLLIIFIAVKYQRIEYAFAIIAGLTFIMLLILLYIFAFKLSYFRKMRVHFDWKLLRTLVNYSSILFINRIIGLICNQSPKFLIWLYLTVSSMTVFDVVSRPANLLRLVMSVLNSAIVPEVARLHQLKDLKSISTLFINLTRYAYLIILPIVAVMGVYINDLLRLWVGEEFVPHAYMALILLAVYIVLPIPSVASTMVVGLEKVKQTIWIAIVSTIINVGLSLSLLQFIGLPGLMIGAFCGEAFGLIPYLLAMKKFLKFQLGDAIKPLFPIAFTSVLFMLMHFALRYVFKGQMIPIISCIAVTLIANYLINYKYLLNGEEKAFLWGRLAALKNKIT